MLRRAAMSSVHGRLAECEQRNGGHLEDVIFFMFCVTFQDHCHSLISANAKSVLPYKRNCIMIYNTLNFL